MRIGFVGTGTMGTPIAGCLIRAGHTLSVVAFPGAAGATLIGIGAGYGYFAFCVGAAVLLALVRGLRWLASGPPRTLSPYLHAAAWVLAGLTLWLFVPQAGQGDAGVEALNAEAVVDYVRPRY